MGQFLVFAQSDLKNGPQRHFYLNLGPYRLMTEGLMSLNEPGARSRTSLKVLRANMKIAGLLVFLFSHMPEIRNTLG